MQLIVDPRGTVRGVYAEHPDLTTIGQPHIIRASHVEPTDSGQWTADLAPVGGPLLGPFPLRSQALDAETNWLNRNWPDCSE